MASRTHRGEVLITGVARCDFIPIKISFRRLAVVELVAVAIDGRRSPMMFKQDVVTFSINGAKVVVIHELRQSFRFELVPHWRKMIEVLSRLLLQKSRVIWK